ncbi:MAG: Spy/CpxP family protein refolding chaperone [Candidatus Coatesbacteria bacterium]|nr:Spy/CpxP family protein refolding chaperone [Candidatus Coatesbacteria bacterium]
MKRIAVVLSLVFVMIIPLYAKGELKDFFKSLSNEQKQKLKEMRKQNQTEIKSHASQIKQYMQEMRTALQSNVIDQSKVNGLIDKIGALRIEMQKKRIANQIKMLQVLTPEQKKQFMQIMESKKKEIGSKMRGKRRPRSKKDQDIE